LTRRIKADGKAAVSEKAETAACFMNSGMVYPAPMLMYDKEAKTEAKR